ncbi:MAG: GNAT family N-acetyltransferase [Hyphomonadaceae bacterium]|nr:GNAT family N-acetyltransferase [Hyphomonadaceae bacterium]
MSTVDYRDAAPSDCDALSALMRETFCETFAHLYRPQDLAAFLAANYTPDRQYAEIIDGETQTRLAVSGGALMGYAQIGPFKLPFDAGPARALELYRLYVRETVQGQGVAAALMTWAMDAMRARAAVHAYLGVWCDNIRAQRFYARYGFEKVGAYKFPVGEALDDEWILRAAL